MNGTDEYVVRTVPSANQIAYQLHREGKIKECETCRRKSEKPTIGKISPTIRGIRALQVIGQSEDK